MFNILGSIFGEFALFKKSVTIVDNSITINAIPNNENISKKHLEENNYEKQDSSLTNEITASKIFFWTCAWAYAFMPANIIILSEKPSVCKKITNLIVDELNKTAAKTHPENGIKQFVVPEELSKEYEVKFLDVLRDMRQNKGSLYIVDLNN